MSDLPAWAMEKAREAIAKQDTHESLSQAIARALVAERAAERERCAKIIDDNSLGNHGLVPRHDGDVHGLAYAVAIRTQGEAK